MWFYIGFREKEKEKKVKRDWQWLYWVLGRERLREFELCILKVYYEKFDLSFLMTQAIMLKHVNILSSRFTLSFLLHLGVVIFPMEFSSSITPLLLSIMTTL